MKRTLLQLALFLSALAFQGCCENSTAKFEGPVTSKTLVTQHQSSREDYIVVFKDTDINRHLRVEVTPDTYYRLQIGENAAFILSVNDLSRYANGEYKELLKWVQRKQNVKIKVKTNNE